MKLLGLNAITAFFVVSCVFACSGSTTAPIVGPAPIATESAISSVNPPDGSSEVALHAVVQATFTQRMKISSIHPGSFTLFRGPNQVPAQVSSDGISATLSPTEELAANADYLVTISGARSEDDRPLSHKLQWRFHTLDNVIPSVLKTMPPDQTINLPQNTEIRATFSIPMEEESVKANFQLADLADQPIPGEIIFSSEDNSASFLPSAHLAAGGWYKAKLLENTKALNGVVLGKVFQWSFRITEAVPLEIVSVSPAIDQNNVDTISPVHIRFNVSADPNSLNSSTFFLKDGGGNQLGASITYDPNTLTASLAPSPPLLFSSSYTVTTTQDIQGIFGNRLKEPRIWSFVTRGESCGNAASIEDKSFKFREIRVSASPSGHAVAVMMRANSNSTTDNDLYVNRFIPGSGWQGVELIEESSTEIQPDAIVKVLADGRAFIAWRQKQTSNTKYQLFVVRYLPGVGWQTRQRMDTDDTINVTRFALDVDPSGNAFVVWNKPSATEGCQIMARRFDAATQTWSEPKILDRSTTDPLNNQGFIQIALDTDDAGNALAVWNQLTTGNAKRLLFASYYNASTQSWTRNDQAFRVDENFNNLLDSGNMNVGLEGGVGCVVYELTVSVNYHTIWGNIFSAAQGSFATPKQLSVDDNGENDSIGPKVGVDSFGNALVAWVRDDNDVSTNRNRIHSLRYLVSGGWEQSLPQTIDVWPPEFVTSQENSIQNLSLHVEPITGNALLSWDKLEDRDPVGDPGYGALTRRSDKNRALDRIVFLAKRYVGYAKVWEASACVFRSANDVGNSSGAMDALGAYQLIWVEDTEIGKNAPLEGNILATRFPE